MQTLRSLERLITSATDVQSIVRTMKTLAAVSIRHYEAAVASLQPYDETVQQGLRMLFRTGTSPPANVRACGRLRGAVVVFGSDQGLCGSFNEEVARFTAVELERRAAPDMEWSILPVGARVIDRLADRDLPSESPLSLPGSLTGITELVTDVLMRIDAWRRELDVSRVLVIHNRRHRGTSFVPRAFRLLPIDLDRLHADPSPATSRCLPFTTMDRDRLLSAVLRQYLFVSLFRACAESLASENASRLASMQAAERAIGDRLESLRGAHQQQRQETITAELNDIVSGFEAQRLEVKGHTVPSDAAAAPNRVRPALR